MNRLIHRRNLSPIAQFLFILNALIWLVFGIISLTGLANSQATLILLIVAILMFGNVLAMLLCAWFLRTQKRLAIPFALAVLLANIILTFTDQFGLFDFLTLLLDFLLLGVILLLWRTSHTQANSTS